MKQVLKRLHAYHLVPQPKGLLYLVLLATGTTFGQDAQIFNIDNANLSTNKLEAVAVGKNNHAYLGTLTEGIIELGDNQDFKIYNSVNSPVKGIDCDPLFSDSEGNIWFAYSKPYQAIIKYDGDNWTIFDKEDIPTSNISATAFAEDKKGNIYFGGANGLFKYNGKAWKPIKLPEDNLIIRALAINKKGEMAIGLNTGLLIGKEGKFKMYTAETTQLQLNTVRAVKFMDDELYIGYGGGFGNGGFSVKDDDLWMHYNKSNSSVPDHMVRDIETDANGVIYMATNDGVIKITDGHMQVLRFRNGAFKNVITDIAIKDNVIWITTDFGLLKIEE